MERENGKRKWKAKMESENGKRKWKAKMESEKWKAKNGKQKMESEKWKAKIESELLLFFGKQNSFLLSQFPIERDRCNETFGRRVRVLIQVAEGVLLSGAEDAKNNIERQIRNRQTQGASSPPKSSNSIPPSLPYW
jgi:hypothetical protein